MQRFRLLLLVPCALVVASRVPAGDWPEFRGPTAQGLYEGKPVPTEWSQEKNIAWFRSLGSGWSSPAIVGGKVYLTTAVPKGSDYSLRAVCIESASGKIA